MASEVINDLEDCSEEVLIQGIIDCYFKEGEDLVLVDYKTGHVFGGNVEVIIDRYRIQMELYKEALEKITKKKVKESYIYLFDIDKEVQI